MHGACYRVSPAPVEPYIVGLAFTRIRYVQPSLEIFNGALRVQLKIPTDELTGNSKAFISQADRPGPGKRLSQQVAQLLRRNAYVIVARRALQSCFDFNGPARRRNEPDAQVGQARMTDIHCQPYPCDLSFPIHDDAPYQRDNLERSNRPCLALLQVLSRIGPLGNTGTVGGREQHIRRVKNSCRTLQCGEAGQQQGVIIRYQAACTLPTMRRR